MSLDLTAFSRAGTPAPARFPPSRAIQEDLFADPEAALPDAMNLVQSDALIVANSSAGKDSQALIIHLVEVLGIPPAQILCVHADLGPSEWEGTEDHARSIAAHYGIEFLVTRAFDKAGEEKTFLSMADRRGKFPDSQNRSCYMSAT